MWTKKFRAPNGIDSLTISHPKNFKDDDDAGITISVKVYHNYKANTELISGVVLYANNRNIQWILIHVNGNYIVPQNAIIYKSAKKRGTIRCHVTDFEEFYKLNMDKIITPQHIYAKKSTKKDKDGWVIRTNVSEVKKEKFKHLKDRIKREQQKEKEEIEKLNSMEGDDDDWTKM